LPRNVALDARRLEIQKREQVHSTQLIDINPNMKETGAKVQATWKGGVKKQCLKKHCLPSQATGGEEQASRKGGVRQGNCLPSQYRPQPDMKRARERGESNVKQEERTRVQHWPLLLSKPYFQFRVNGNSRFFMTALLLLTHLCLSVYAQPRLVTKENLTTAIDMWIADQESAKLQFGPIDEWDTSAVNSMSFSKLARNILASAGRQHC
jgi:hypothetical protein